ncbi:hypothetical protein BdWA1_002400 [Babesia duncani]|uniref:Uncharacterized protein n=1 Tax=Babesia duncani TaxID=323732 RepID=A0AAD9UNH3_9APIC|nr:hypothetical protein BdWA1_002400 [Babesia duncani]
MIKRNRPTQTHHGSIRNQRMVGRDQNTAPVPPPPKPEEQHPHQQQEKTSEPVPPKSHGNNNTIANATEAAEPVSRYIPLDVVKDRREHANEGQNRTTKLQRDSRNSMRQGRDDIQNHDAKITDHNTGDDVYKALLNYHRMRFIEFKKHYNLNSDIVQKQNKNSENDSDKRMQSKMGKARPKHPFRQQQQQQQQPHEGNPWQNNNGTNANMDTNRNRHGRSQNKRQTQ